MSQIVSQILHPIHPNQLDPLPTLIKQIPSYLLPSTKHFFFIYLFLFKNVVNFFKQRLPACTDNV